MPGLPPDFKAELLAKANESLRRHFARVDSELQQQARDAPPPSDAALASFAAHLAGARRVLALLGAGLSAPSGIPTYRGPGGFWRAYSDQQLSTPGAFRADPVLVWRFYEHRRAQALAARPNAGHVALAELAGAMPGGGFLAVNQNVDELCSRAGLPAEQIINFHGSLFRVRCVDDVGCGYEADDYNSPITPGLAVAPGSDDDDESNGQRNLFSSRIPEREQDVAVEHLPYCPRCKTNLLRPAVIWFGEGVPEDRAARVEAWLQDEEGEGEGKSKGGPIDLMLVVGTSAMVRPASGYITRAREQGARVAFFNLEERTAGIARPEEADWSFVGDASVLLPLALKGYLEKQKKGAEDGV